MIFACSIPSLFVDHYGLNLNFIFFWMRNFFLEDEYQIITIPRSCHTWIGNTCVWYGFCWLKWGCETSWILFVMPLFWKIIYIFFFVQLQGGDNSNGIKKALGRGFEPRLDHAECRSCNSEVRVRVLWGQFLHPSDTGPSFAELRTSDGVVWHVICIILSGVECDHFFVAEWCRNIKKGIVSSKVFLKALD